MKRTMDREQKILIITELTNGMDLTKQLSNNLNPSSSPETPQYLIENIISSYEKALSMLKYNNASLKSNSMVESPCSFPNTTPRSQLSDQDCKDVCKKRKTMPRRTEQVKVCLGTGLEGTLGDSYCWRKYGQKNILGAKFPRGYYRCTHRQAQGCLATKQVQRSDADPTIFEVTHRGRHTCNQNSHLAAALASTSSTEEVSELKVKTEDLVAGESIFPSFSIGHENIEDNLYLEMGCFSPAFISPATSESNYLSMSSPCHMNNFGLGHSHNVQTPESELELTAEMLSTPSSVPNSPYGDFDFSLAKEDLDTNFLFDYLDSCF